jgi:YVTN family beta-propeller protein
MTQYRFPIFFCSLFLCIVSCAQSQPVTGLDEPSEHDDLKRNIWLAAMGTSYDQAVSYTNLAQEQSQKTLTHELVLPTGWKIKPAGQVLELGTMPSEMVSFSNRLVILNNGFYPPKADSQVSVVNPFKNTLEKNLPFHSLFPSAVTGPDGNLYISGGYDFKVYRLNRQMKPTKDHSNYIVNGYAGGLAFTGKTRLALTYLMVNKQGTGVWEKGKIALLDTSTGKILDEIGTGHYPCALEWTRSKLYATIEGENRVQIYSSGGDKLVEGASIPVGKNPTNLTSSQGLLYVVNSNSDEISVIDTQTDQAVNTFDLKQQGFKYGAGPNSVAADKDRLYVSLAGWNAVAVLNKVDGKLLGLIPAGWYPTKVYLDKKNLYVLSAKGVRPQRPTVRDKGVEGLRKEDPYYILNAIRCGGSPGGMDCPGGKGFSPGKPPRRLQTSHQTCFLRHPRKPDLRPDPGGPRPRRRGPETLRLPRTQEPQCAQAGEGFRDLGSFFLRRGNQRPGPQLHNLGLRQPLPRMDQQHRLCRAVRLEGPG